MHMSDYTFPEANNMWNKVKRSTCCVCHFLKSTFYVLWGHQWMLRPICSDFQSVIFRTDKQSRAWEVILSAGGTLMVHSLQVIVSWDCVGSSDDYTKPESRVLLLWDLLNKGSPTSAYMKWTIGNNIDKLINGGLGHFFFITVEYFIYLLLLDVMLIIALNIRAASV